MTAIPPTRLVWEIAALRAGPATPTRSATPGDPGQGGRGISSEAGPGSSDTGADVPGIRLAVPLPPPETGLIAALSPPAAQLDRARAALEAYERWLATQDDQKPTLPARHARLTGLPRFMNGLLPTRLTDLQPETVQTAAATWLFERPPVPDAPPAPASCLSGLDDPQAVAGQLRFLDAIAIPDCRTETNDQGDPGRLVTAIHARFQQKHGPWPVLGGRVIVHMAEGARRCSVSSAYLPIPAERFAHYQLRSAAEAIAIARLALIQHAINGQVEKNDALGLLLDGLQRALDEAEADDPSRATQATGRASLPTWPQVLQAIITALEMHMADTKDAEQTHTVLGRLRAALADPSRAGVQEARNALAELTDILASDHIPAWDEGRIVPYLSGLAGTAELPNQCFVMPFADDYYLTYRVEFLTETRDRGWRIYVNADAADARCDVVGWPESLLAHVLDIFPTSADAITGTTQAVGAAGIDLSFLTLGWHEDVVNGAPGLTLAEIEGNPTGLDAALVRDAANVAYHASEFHRYFLGLCPGQTLDAMREDISRRPPYFEVRLGVPAHAGEPLGTGFLASAAAPTILFQDANTLRVGLRTVQRPASDPEVIYHELTHALMWLINSEPFDQAAGVTPFARSLIEGYANYYARACAVSRHNDVPTAPWARACYRVQEFADRYDLAHDSARDPAGNRLPVPNLFPPPATQDPDASDAQTIRLLQYYSIGMVWARALWELRERYRAEGLDPLLADRRALSAYFYMPGWLASFETAAEGVLDQMAPTQAARLAGQFGARNILAGRGVQALALAGAEVLAATDVGVRRSAAAAIAWAPWERFPAGEGVTALAHDPVTGKTFAATERGVYAWDAAAATWTPHGTWKTNLNQEIPLCLATVAGMVYAGTATGLYALAATAAGGDWTRWEGDQRLRYLVRDVAVAQEVGPGGVNETVVYVATLREARKRRLAENELDPEGVQWGDAASLGLQAQMAATTAVTIMGGAVYLGTLEAGIWRQENLANNTAWQRIADPADFGNAAVLTLRVRQTATGPEVLAGTSAGLYHGRLATGTWSWSAIAFDNDPTVHETITAVLYLSDTVWLIGTANRGLWRVETPAVGPRLWTQYPDIGL